MITNLATMSLDGPTYRTRIGRHYPGGTIMPNGMIRLEPPAMYHLRQRLFMDGDADRAAAAMALLTCPADKPTRRRLHHAAGRQLVDDRRTGCAAHA